MVRLMRTAMPSFFVRGCAPAPPACRALSFLKAIMQCAFVLCLLALARPGPCQLTLPVCCPSPLVPQRLEVLMHIITVTFDMNQPMHEAMKVPNWNRCAATLFDILVGRPAIIWLGV